MELATLTPAQADLMQDIAESIVLRLGITKLCYFNDPDLGFLVAVRHDGPTPFDPQRLWVHVLGNRPRGYRDHAKFAAEKVVAWLSQDGHINYDMEDITVDEQPVLCFIPA